MASSLRLIRQDDFTGGLNLRADQFQLAPNESPRMLNVEIDPRGGVFSRGAMRRVNTTAITGTWNPKKVFAFDGATNYAMFTTGFESATNGKVWYSTGGNFTNITNIDVSSPDGASFAPWGNTLYGVTGASTQSFSWSTGTTATLLTASGPTWQNSYLSPTGGYFPKASHAITHAGKVFVANTYEDSIAYPNRIRWSHPNSPEDWASTDYIDIKDGGEEITGLASIAGHLVVFKKKSVFAIFGYDSDTFQVVEVSRNVGSLSGNAYASTERGVYFFSYPEGLMVYNGERVLDLFEPMRPMFDLGYVNTASLDSIFVNYINQRVWVSLPYSEITTLTYSSMSFVYDPGIGQRGAWVQHSTADGRGINCGTTFVSDAGTTYNLAAHATEPRILNIDMFDQTQDNITGTDTSFTSRYRTKWYDAGTYSQKKMFKRPDIVAKQSAVAGNMQVKVFRDYEEADGTEIRAYTLALPQTLSGMIWGTSQWGVAYWGAPNRGSQLIKGRNMGLARSIQLEFVGPGGVAWGINSHTLKYSPRRVTA